MRHTKLHAAPCPDPPDGAQHTKSAKLRPPLNSLHADPHCRAPGKLTGWCAAQSRPARTPPGSSTRRPRAATPRPSPRRSRPGPARLRGWGAGCQVGGRDGGGRWVGRWPACGVRRTEAQGSARAQRRAAARRRLPLPAAQAPSRRRVAHMSRQRSRARARAPGNTTPSCASVMYVRDSQRASTSDDTLAPPPGRATLMPMPPLCAGGRAGGRRQQGGALQHTGLGQRAPAPALCKRQQAAAFVFTSTICKCPQCNYPPAQTPRRSAGCRRRPPHSRRCACEAG